MPSFPRRAPSSRRAGQGKLGAHGKESPMTAVFCGRFPSCSRQEGGSPGDGGREGERGGGK